jgi:hypothetical protein
MPVLVWHILPVGKALEWLGPTHRGTHQAVVPRHLWWDSGFQSSSYGVKRRMAKRRLETVQLLVLLSNVDAESDLSTQRLPRQ